MLPLRDDNPHFLTPFVTLLLIASNVAVWTFVQGFGSEPQLVRSVCELGLIPAALLGGSASGSGICQGLPAGGVGTLLSSMFLHGGLGHIAGNMWFLWIFGNNVEDSMGHVRFSCFYVLCGLVAAFAQILVEPRATVPMVGASGAIGGVMGAYLVLYPRVRVHMLGFFGIPFTFSMPALWMLGYWFAIQLVSGYFSLQLGAAGQGVAFWAHIGGFAAGVLMIPLFRVRELVERHPCYGWTRERSRSPWERRY